MPRRPRSFQAGVVYHLISRFVASEWFIKTESDRKTYLHLLGRALADSDWRCFAFAVMSNHVHLAVIAGMSPLSSWICDVHGPFAEWINERHARIGSVFVRGPAAIAIQHERAERLVGYIHRNPVRAGVVQHASDSAWTSHRAYLAPGIAPSWLDVDSGLALTRFAEGAALDRWIESTEVTRADVDEVRVEPVDRGGRPRKPAEKTGDGPGYFRAPKNAKPAGAAAGFYE